VRHLGELAEAISGETGVYSADDLGFLMCVELLLAAGWVEIRLD
jgi:hypothetical protein